MSTPVRTPPAFKLEPQEPPADAAAGNKRAWPEQGPALRRRTSRLIGRLDEPAADLLVIGWPKQLIALLSVVEAATERYLAELPAGQRPQARVLASQITAALADYLGGLRIWIPRAGSVARLLRDWEIYRRFDGRNVSQLARRFRLDKVSVYRAIERIRQLRRRAARPGE